MKDQLWMSKSQGHKRPKIEIWNPGGGVILDPFHRVALLVYCVLAVT